MANTSRWSVERLRPAFSVTMQLVQKAGEFWGVETWRLLKRERTREIAYPRFGVIWALRECGLTYWAIAKHMNYKEHTAVMHAYRQATRLRSEDNGFKEKTDDLLAYARALRLVQTTNPQTVAA